MKNKHREQCLNSGSNNIKEDTENLLNNSINTTTVGDQTFKKTVEKVINEFETTEPILTIEEVESIYKES